MGNVSDKVAEKIKTPLFYYKKFCRLRDKVEKYCKVGLATDDNMVHTHCMLDT
jgi:hypothetical protein